jgi:OOP family OmpA-OmpF porin
MNKAMLAGLATLGLVATGTTFAQSTGGTAQSTGTTMPWTGEFWNRGYVGVSGGESKFEADCRSTNVFNCDKRDTAWKVYGGGRINEILGLEIGYTDFGKLRASGGDTDAWAIPISLTAGVPLGDRFNIFGKIGGLYGRTDVRAEASTLVDTGHKNGWGWTWGGGAAFKITQNLDLRVDWDRYKLDFRGGRRDIDMLSGGVQFRF